MIFQPRRKYDSDSVLFSEDVGKTVAVIVKILIISKLLPTSVAILPFC